jgi:hypothetical protein
MARKIRVIIAKRSVVNALYRRLSEEWCRLCNRELMSRRHLSFIVAMYRRRHAALQKSRSVAWEPSDLPLYARRGPHQQRPARTVGLASRQNTLTGLGVADFIFWTRDDSEIWRFAVWRHPHGSGGTPVRDAIRGSPMRSFFASQDLAKQRFNSPRFAVRRRSGLTRWTCIQYTLFIAVQVLPARAARQHLKLDHRAVRRGSCLARGAGVGNTPIIAVEVFVGRTATLATGQGHHSRRAV